MLNFYRAISLLIISTLFVSCANIADLEEPEERREQLISASHMAANELLRHSKGKILPEDTLLASTFVDVNNLAKSSQLGRTVTELVVSKLTQKGYTVKEIKLRKGGGFKVRRNGEFVLSRQIQEISRDFKARFVLTGTYSTSIDFVFLTVRIVRIIDNTIISSHDFAIDMDKNVNYLVNIQNQN
ncbi:MAG: hypothetical protein HQL71_15480 [Magnetococcales bacterium]|nr:hypothetical protein [Magnetococcales bacterium]